MKAIARKYGLGLDGDWNKEMLPHQGRHPNDYHRFVLEEMQNADAIASRAPRWTRKKIFLEEFEKRVKNPVRENPDLLRKIGWE